MEALTFYHKRRMCCKVENIAPSFDGIEHLPARPIGYAPAFSRRRMLRRVFFPRRKGAAPCTKSRRCDQHRRLAAREKHDLYCAERRRGRLFPEALLPCRKASGAGDDAGRHGAFFVESMCCLKCFVLSAIRPVVSRKKRIFFRSLWAGRRGAAASHVTL